MQQWADNTAMRYSNRIHWIAGDEAGSNGLELQIDWDAGEAVLRLIVPSRSQAAPGIAHGGFLAALADHVMGFVASQHGGTAVATRQMSVDYLAPTQTSRPVMVRARPETVTDRTVTVSLEGSAADSGQVTFRARGDYARVSAARGHRASARTDYDTLEERFDPSQVFAWLVAALKDSYVPGTLSSPAVLVVEVLDARPDRWTFKLGDHSLDVEVGEPPEYDVRFAGTVRSLRELVYGVKTADQLAATGSAVVEDPASLLPSVLRSLAS